MLLALALASPAQALDRAVLQATLAKLHAGLGPSAGAYVVDLGTGQALFANRENLPLAPASNEKLFVTSAALLRFGATGTLSTQLRSAPCRGITGARPPAAPRWPRPPGSRRC